MEAARHNFHWEYDLADAGSRIGVGGFGYSGAAVIHSLALASLSEFSMCRSVKCQGAYCVTVVVRIWAAHIVPGP